MRALVAVLLGSLLTSCAFVDGVMSHQPLPDTRIVVYRGQRLRVPYRDIDQYRCHDGGPIMAEGLVRGGKWEITCERSL